MVRPLLCLYTPLMMSKLRVPRSKRPKGAPNHAFLTLPAILEQTRGRGLTIHGKGWKERADFRVKHIVTSRAPEPSVSCGKRPFCPRVRRMRGTGRDVIRVNSVFCWERVPVSLIVCRYSTIYTGEQKITKITLRKGKKGTKIQLQQLEATFCCGRAAKR